MSAGPVGYLYHRSSKMLAGPFTLSTTPGNDERMALHSSKNFWQSLQFRVIPVDGYWGYIEHVSSKKVIHPKGGSLQPKNNATLVVHSDRHKGAEFLIDPSAMEIIHYGSRKWHPRGGSQNPSDDTTVVLHSDTHDGAKFYFGDLDGNPISPYPSPDLSGYWTLIQSYITPPTDQTYTDTYKVGRSKTDCSRETKPQTPSLSAEVAKGLFEKSDFAEATNSETWSEETEATYKVGIKAGQSVYIWQYVFRMSQCGEEILFKSSIIEGTDNSTKKPKIK